MRILFATTAGAGHLGPLVPFAAAATELGHDVCVAAPGSAESAVRRVGLPFHAVGESSDAERGAMFASMRGASFNERNTIMLRDGFAGIFAGAALPAMSDLIEHWRPDVVVRESLEFSSLAAAAAHGVPHVQVATNLLVTLEDVMARVRPRVIELLATTGVGAERSTSELDERLLSLVPPSLERPDDRNRAARYRAQGVDRSTRSNGHRPLVFLSLGTESAGQLYPALYRDAIDAIADGSRDVLVTLGRAVDPAALGQLPGSVRVEPWVDQAEVLSRTAVSVCHGGTGTVIGSLAAGAPVVILPLFSMDHWQTGARVAEAGAGIVLDGPGDVAQLGPAVREVLEQPRFRERAGEISRETSSLPPASDAVRALEALPARVA
jgi:UDP:flavonoid glycosyltransferase YjiC (YdhE family)